MDWLYILQATVLGIVEGLTEFLPISSTGHLIIASDIVGFAETAGSDEFVVAIQSGAIFAVCWYYRARIWRILRRLFSDPKEQRLAINTIVAFLPAAVIGVLVASYIKHYLFNPVAVAIALIVGGILILWIENRQARLSIEPRVKTMDDMTWKDALAVGFMQCLAMIPGTSRSGATIIGGLVLGLSRRAATEFSFFLAIPTIFGATVYDLWKGREDLVFDNLTGLAVGTIVSFVSALLVVHWLLRFVSSNDFKGFGWYRIIFGIIVLAATSFGWIEWRAV
ncbi:undecaprenyl-diphosphate phosphatase [Sutterella sp.]|uniref:undecaprenyl-diphosphate phosphatase n=1 Tax=Sutterella sp. TaxID=1981025 RepID=UPI0026DEABEF|nr:undecaprenyl-diphosphate phosphatase [Sutterella sp.]MDO5532405.1 undecaprenyl-diphosphate phosphatase [Sutterella sp.]